MSHQFQVVLGAWTLLYVLASLVVLLLLDLFVDYIPYVIFIQSFRGLEL